jgi:hypothetical protein
VHAAVVANATTGAISNPGTGSPNRLLFSPPGGATPPPPPPPPPPPECGGTTYTGSLSASNTSDVHPNGTYYQSTASGVHRGCLSGPAGTDFDLVLFRWNGFAWAQVAISDGPTSTERIDYNGTPGFYYWRIQRFSGSGSYTFQLTRP